LTYIGAEQTATGYEVAIKIQGADQYTVWNTDNNGNVVSNGTGGVLVSGSSSVFKSYETLFQQDLNGNGVISVSAPVHSANEDSFTFRTDLLPAHKEVAGFESFVSREISGAAVHNQVENLVSASPELGPNTALPGAMPELLAENHLNASLFGHVIIQ
jgi:tryptophan-rich protein